MNPASTLRGARLGPSEQSAENGGGVRPGTRILIVDEEPELLDLLLAYFLAAEYEVETATNGTEAVVAVSRQRPDVVLLDINMPCVNGVEALKEIMKIDQSIAVLMVTGNGELPVTVDAIRNGAFGYVPKPFDLRYLDHLIAASLGRSQPRRSNASRDAPPRTPKTRIQNDASTIRPLAIGGPSRNFGTTLPSAAGRRKPKRLSTALARQLRRLRSPAADT